MTAAAKFHKGQTVYVRGDRQWTKGIITDLFLSPLSDRWVYVVGGNGYYAPDVSELLDDPA